MKHDIFLSYSRVDAAFAQRLVRDLERCGIDCWLDQVDIPPGVNWDDEIEKALDQAKTMLVILSDASGKSENVKNEIGAALERGKQVVPVLLAKGAVPLRINRLQREDFSGDYDAALAKLVRRLSGGTKTVSLPATAPQDARRSTPVVTENARRATQPASQPDSLTPATSGQLATTPAKSRRALLFGAGAGAVMLALGVVAALQGSGTQAPAPPAPAPTKEPQTTDPAPVPLPPPVPGPTPVVPPAPGPTVVDPGAKGPVRPSPNPKPSPVTPVRPVTPVKPSYGAVLCRDPGYGGVCESIGQNGDLGGTRVGNDSVSSLRLGTCRAVKVCTDGFFAGACSTFAKDQPDMSATRIGDNRASSVTCVDANPRGALLCPEPGFRGECETIMKSADLGESTVGNDTVSSLRLGTCRAVTLCPHGGFGGECDTFTADQPDLSGTLIGDDNASSVECIRTVTVPSTVATEEPQPEAPTTEQY